MQYIMILPEAFEEVEALAVHDLLKRAAIDITLISLANEDITTSSSGVAIYTPVHFNHIQWEIVRGIILPGGPGYVHYQDNTVLKDMIMRLNESKKLIAAICAAPTYLASIGLLENTLVTCYPPMKNTIIQHGGIFENEKVVVSDNIVTSMSMGTAIDFGLSLISYIKNEKELEIIKDSIYYS